MNEFTCRNLPAIRAIQAAGANIRHRTNTGAQRVSSAKSNTRSGKAIVKHATTTRRIMTRRAAPVACRLQGSTIATRV